MTDTLHVRLALPGYSDIPPNETFVTNSFPYPHGRTYVICEKGDLFRYGPRKKTTETGETIEIPDTNDREYLTEFSDIIRFQSEVPAEPQRNYYAAFKAGKLQQIWYDTRN
jgi:hypothetical protein